MSYPSFSEVIGTNAKRLRGDLSGDRLASAARRRGLNWGTGRVADLEAGRVSPTMPMLISLALALGDIRGAPIKLADLVATDQFVSVTGDLVLSGEALVHFVTDWPVQVVMRYIPGGMEEVAALIAKSEEVSNRYLAALNPGFVDVDKRLAGEIYQRTGEAESRAAKALGVDEYDLAFASAFLWGRSLADERDVRSGPTATAQKRGRITRQLYDELKAAINGDD